MTNQLRQTLPQKIILRLLRTKIITAIIAPIAPKLDRYLIRKTNGKHSFASVITGLPIIMLKCIGAKSGIERSVPLVGIPEGSENYIVVASNWGRPKHPDWYYNLRKNPNIVVEHDSKRQKYIAHELSSDEKEAYWENVVNVYRGYENYAERAFPREISLFLLKKQIPT